MKLVECHKSIKLTIYLEINLFPRHGIRISINQDINKPSWFGINLS